MSEKNPYYVAKASDSMLELRQERFRGKNHPHDVCAVSRDVEQLRDTVSVLSEDAKRAVEDYARTVASVPKTREQIEGPWRDAHEIPPDPTGARGIGEE